MISCVVTGVHPQAVWIQNRVGKAADEDQQFEWSEQAVIQKGETISADHETLINDLVQDKLNNLQTESDEEKFRIAQEAEEYFIANYDCSTVDGVRIKFGDGWGLVRSSNTQPVIVCRFEANTQERMEEIKDLVLSKLLTIGKLEIEVGH